MTQKYMKLLLLVSCMVPMAATAKSDCGKSVCGRPAPTKQQKRSVAMHDAALADQSVDDTATRKKYNSLEVENTLDVGGQAVVGSLIVEGSEQVGKDLAVDGTLYVERINGAVTLNGSLTVNGPETVTGPVVIGSETNPVAVTINGCNAASLTGGVALCQYANFYGTATQTINALDPRVKFSTTSVTTGGITNAPATGVISGFLGGNYLITYMVTGVIDETGTPPAEFEFALVKNASTTAPFAGTVIAASDFSLAPAVAAVGSASVSNEMQLSGQCVVTLAAGDTLELQGVTFGTGGDYLLEAGGAVDVSITIEKIG